MDDFKSLWLRANDIPAYLPVAELDPTEKPHAFARGAHDFGAECTFATLGDDVRDLVPDAFNLHVGDAGRQEVPHLRASIENVGAIAHVAVMFPDLVVGPSDIICKGLHCAVGIALVDIVEVGMLQEGLQLRL